MHRFSVQSNHKINSLHKNKIRKVHKNKMVTIMYPIRVPSFIRPYSKYYKNSKTLIFSNVYLNLNLIQIRVTQEKLLCSSHMIGPHCIRHEMLLVATVNCIQFNYYYYQTQSGVNPQQAYCEAFHIYIISWINIASAGWFTLQGKIKLPITSLIVLTSIIQPILLVLSSYS